MIEVEVVEKGGSKEKYISAKQITSIQGIQQKTKFSNLEHGCNDFVYRIAAQIRADSRYVIGDKCVKDNHGNLSVTTDAKKEAWK